MDGLQDLVGAWELRSCTRTTPSGRREYQYGRTPRGVIMYTPDAWMSCHMAFGDEVAGLPDLTERRVEYSGYHGPVVMRPEENVVEHHVRGASLDWMIGTVQERSYRVEGTTLYLSAQMDSDAIEVVWSKDRYSPAR